MIHRLVMNSMNQRQGGENFFFQEAGLHDKKRLTPRITDQLNAVRFLSGFHALEESRFQSFPVSRPPTSNASRYQPLQELCIYRHTVHYLYRNLFSAMIHGEELTRLHKDCQIENFQ
jgi:hypothetical protein